MLANADYPLIRFGTGDLSASLPGKSPCGRTNMRIKGWLGRADQTTKVKGMFVHPSQVAAIVRRHPEIVRARLVVDNPEGSDRMTLHVEVAGNASSTRTPSSRRSATSRSCAAKSVFTHPANLPTTARSSTIRASTTEPGAQRYNAAYATIARDRHRDHIMPEIRRTADLFAPLRGNTLRAIAAEGVVRTFPKSAMLINEGEPANRCSSSCRAG